jgi:hypothetical protein
VAVAYCVANVALPIPGDGGDGQVCVGGSALDTPVTADVASGDADRADEGPRIASGRVDRLFALTRRLPGPTPIWWFAFFVAMTVVPSGILWVAGTQPPGEVDSRIWVASLLAAYCFSLRQVLDGIATRAFRAFEPALGDDVDKRGLARGLVSIPDRTAVLTVLVVEAVITVGYFSDPGELAHLLAVPLVEQAVILVTNWISIAITAVLLIHIVGQLRMVTRLHRLANVDLFDPRPAHAFARLTSATAIGILVFEVVVVTDPVVGRETLFFAAEVGGIMLLALAVFALPLRGMQGRLAAEKARLLGATNERIKVTVARIHASVDADDLQRSGNLHESLSSLIAERELVTKLSTWPWSTGTFRGFASALVLPIVIWAITRVLERVV